jgi:hypothetical protein
VTDLFGLTLQYDVEILPVNGEEGNVRPDCVRYASVGWDKLTITTGAGDIYEVPLMNHAAVVAGGYAPGSLGFSLHDHDAATLDGLLVRKPTPALTVDSKGRVTAGASLTADDLPGHTHTAADIVSGEVPHRVQKDGADVGTRRALNLVQGNRVSLAAADDPANDRVSVTISASPPEASEITNALGYIPANRAGDHFTGPIDCGPHQTIGGPLENMAKYSEDLTAATWDKNGGSCAVTSNAVIAPDGSQTADVITAVTDTPVIQQQIAGLADGGTYTFYIWARVASGTRKVSLAIVDNAYAAYLAGPTQITLTTSWQRFRITGALATGQIGLWIVFRQYAANNPSGWAGVLRVKSPAGTTLGYILLYTDP